MLSVMWEGLVIPLEKEQGLYIILSFPYLPHILARKMSRTSMASSGLIGHLQSANLPVIRYHHQHNYHH